MNIRPPHFLLFSGACRNRLGDNSSLSDGWRFVLESINGDDSFEVADAEPGVAGERLELLAVVRGLEALNQPSQVTLITASRYVNSGMHFGLDQWRDDDWRWERFGHRVSVNNADLWKRVDRALQYHSVECKYWRADPAPSLRQASGLCCVKRSRVADRWPCYRCFGSYQFSLSNSQPARLVVSLTSGVTSVVGPTTYRLFKVQHEV